MTKSDDKLRTLLTDFGFAMLVTRTSRGDLRARPMAVADVDFEGTIWLLTDRHSVKMDEIDQDCHVNITMQSGTKYVSLSGKAISIDDPGKISELWRDSWKIWFPGGKNDPSLVLLKVRGETGEYWDNSGVSGIKYLIEAGKAYLSGTRPDVCSDPKLHGKVSL